MDEFISKYRDQISGVITGFDRLVFRGNLALNHEAGMKGYLFANGIRWKDYELHSGAGSTGTREIGMILGCKSSEALRYNGIAECNN